MPLAGGGLTGSPGGVTHTLQADFSGTAFGGTPTWTDITAYWMSASSDPGGSPATIPWGRQDQSTTVESSSTSFTLNNADGRFTPGKVSSPYYPNVKRRVRMRHTISDGTTTLTLFDGYVDSWTVTPQTSGPTLATASLSDGFARLQVSTALRAMVIEEMLLDSPTSLYPLDEPAGSTSAGDLTGRVGPATAHPSKYGTGTFAFGSGAPPIVGATSSVYMASPDSGTNTQSARGTYLSVPASFPATGGFTWELWFEGPPAAPAYAEMIIYRTYPGVNETLINIDTAGHLFTFTAGGLFSTTGAVNVCDGQWHHLALTMSTDRKTWTVILDGVSQTSTSATAAGPDTGVPLLMGMLVASDAGYQSPFTGSFAMIAQYGSALTSTRVAAHRSAGLTALAGESTSQRWARLLSYRPNLGGSTTGTLGTVGTGDINGISVGDALTDTATAEGGVIQTNRGAITLIGRSNWYNATPTVTLNAANGEVDLPTSWRDDTQAIVNDVTVSRPGGASQRVVNTASTTGADGVAQASVTANLNSDRDAADMAGWLVAVGVMEHLDCPTLTVNLKARASAALTMAVCALKTFDAVILTNLPASAPATTMTFQAQGGTYTVGADTFSVDLYTTTMPPTVLRADATADAYTKLDGGNIIGW